MTVTIKWTFCQISFSRARMHTNIKLVVATKEEGVIVARRNRDCHLCVYDWRQRRRDFIPESFSRNGEPPARFSACSLWWHNELLFPLKMTPSRVSLKILIVAGETPARIKRHYNGCVCVRTCVRGERPRPDWIVNYLAANYSWRAFALVK